MNKQIRLPQTTLPAIRDTSPTLARIEPAQVQEALGAESGIQSGRSYPVWSPAHAFAAAASLLRALDEEKDQP
jgi:hypothetical protein